MKIFDLTRGKYNDLYDPLYNYRCYLDEMAELCCDFVKIFTNNKISKDDIVKLLSKIPVFLVESTMEGEYVNVPQNNCLIQVPNSMMVESCEDFDINSWLEHKEGLRKNNEPNKIEIRDLLGAYYADDSGMLVPRKIFIWLDKIKETAKNLSKPNERLRDNIYCLFDKVLFHEMAHALMDVQVYGIYPETKFSYKNDYVYRFYEEAYANYIALKILDKTPNKVNYFIQRFVENQGDGYAAGWDLYKRYSDDADQWMAIKVLFNYDIACLIKESWDRYIKLPECFKRVFNANWIAVKNRFEKFYLLDALTLQRIDGFKEYDSFWSFGEDGLCMVRLDQEKGYLYGFINLYGKEQIPVEYDYIYSFENNITIAKKDGRYGAIDMNNNVVIQFNLDYEDIRAFRNGRAAVKNSAGKWGVINTKGELIVPCENDTIIL